MSVPRLNRGLVPRNQNMIQEYANRALQCLQKSENDRILIALAGVPGSGKSTMAHKISDYINNTLNVRCTVMGIDGFHLSRAQLRSLPDPQLAFARRGAPFTLDAEAVVQFVHRLRKTCQTSKRGVIYAPSFDHKLKDPVPNGVTIAPETSIVIIEGLYLLLDSEPWKEIASLVDEKWMLEADLQVCRTRVAKRHVEAGIEPDLELAYRRVDSNDLVNAEYILLHSAPVVDMYLH